MVYLVVLFLDWPKKVTKNCNIVTVEKKIQFKILVSDL